MEPRTRGRGVRMRSRRRTDRFRPRFFSQHKARAIAWGEPRSFSPLAAMVRCLVVERLR
jgi:hypothetical protein